MGIDLMEVLIKGGARLWKKGNSVKDYFLGKSIQNRMLSAQVDGACASKVVGGGGDPGKVKRLKLDCRVCRDNEPSTLLLPCEHHICKTCREKVTECPLCREKITGEIHF